MSNAIDNTFSIAFDARIAYENDKATACDASYKLLTSAKKFYEQSLVAAFVAEVALDASFINEQETSNSRFCMKAIDRTTDYVQYALSATMTFIKTENARNVLQTAINLLSIESNMTRNDAYASCTSKQDKSFSVDKEREKHIARRDTMISAAKRQASMSLKALVALDILREVRKDEFALNTESALTQRILAKA